MDKDNKLQDYQACPKYKDGRCYYARTFSKMSEKWCIVEELSLECNYFPYLKHKVKFHTYSIMVRKTGPNPETIWVDGVIAVDFEDALRNGIAKYRQDKAEAKNGHI